MRKMSRYYSVLYTKKAPNKVAVPAHLLSLCRTKQHPDCKRLILSILSNLQKRKNRSFADGLLALDGTRCRLYDEVVTRPTPIMLIQSDRDKCSNDKQCVSRLGPSSFRMSSKVAMIWLGG